jgi:nucleoside-diphosphate-sugar epimerase
MPTSLDWVNHADRRPAVKISVTGADGFVGRHLVRRLVETGHEVTAGCRPGGEPLDRWIGERWRGAIRVKSFELTDTSSVDDFITPPVDAVVHLRLGEIPAAPGSLTRRERPVW